MKQARVLHKALTVVVLLSLVLVSCGAPPATLSPTVESTQAPTEAATDAPTKAASTRGQGGTLTMLYFQAPTIVNPHLSVGDKDLAASRITYEPLANFDKNGNMIPILAAEVPTIDNGELAKDGPKKLMNTETDARMRQIELVSFVGLRV